MNSIQKPNKMEMEMEKKRKLDMMPNIPNDIVVEILLRFSAKSLLRLRWACKYWFDLISRDPHFTKMHLYRHSSTSTSHYNETTMSMVSCIAWYFSCTNVDYSKNCTCGRGVHVSSEVINLSSSNPQTMGTCNGLILLNQIENNEQLCIWNPCTDEYKILPLPQVHPLKHLFPLNNYGLGYDHATGDYKVIRNTYFHDSRIYDLNNSDVQVYTLGTNSWRRIEPNPYRLHSNRYNAEGVLVNGALYWMDYLHENIISFDIEKEKFQHVAKTHNFTNHDKDSYIAKFDEHFGRSTLMLHLFEGSLCISRKIEEEQRNYYPVEMWVLTKDYIAKNNGETLWTKLATVRNLSQLPIKPTRNLSQLPIKPLRYTRNREILMLIGSTDLVLYDPRNNKHRNLGTICGRDCDEMVKDIYSESLVSLNSGTYTRQNLDRNEYGQPVLELRKPLTSDDDVEEIEDDDDEEIEDDGQY